MDPVKVNWNIDSPMDVAAWLVIVLFAGMVALRLLTMLSRGEISLKSIGKRKPKPELIVPEILTPVIHKVETCTSYVGEHTEMLHELKDGQAALKSNIEGIEAMQQAVSEGVCLLMQHARGDRINGEFEEVRMRIERARGYREAKKEAS